MSSMGFKRFLDNQFKIYQTFDSSKEKIKSEGLKRNLPETDGGYHVFFRHNPIISMQIEQLSRTVNGIVPSMIYNAYSVHTTIVTYNLAVDFEPNNGILSKLKKATSPVVNIGLKPKVNFDSWLLNSDSIIAKGVPNEDFYRFVSKVTKNLAELDLNARPAWGAHITAVRFRGDRNGEQKDSILDLVPKLPGLGRSELDTVEVGYFRFINDVYQTFPVFKFELKF